MWCSELLCCKLCDSVATGAQESPCLSRATVNWTQRYGSESRWLQVRPQHSKSCKEMVRNDVCPICLLLHFWVQVILFLKNELWDTLQKLIIRMHYPQQSNHWLWDVSRELWLHFATQILSNQAARPARLADGRPAVGNSLHPSNHLSEPMHLLVTVVSSPPPLWWGLSGTDIWELQQEWWRHKFRIRQDGSDDDMSAQMCWNLAIFTSWPHLQLVGGNPTHLVCHILHIATSHQRKGKTSKNYFNAVSCRWSRNQPAHVRTSERGSQLLCVTCYLTSGNWCNCQIHLKGIRQNWVTQAEGK